MRLFIFDILNQNIIIDFSKFRRIGNRIKSCFLKKALTLGGGRHIIAKAKQEPPASHPPASARRGYGKPKDLVIFAG